MQETMLIFIFKYIFPGIWLLLGAIFLILGIVVLKNFSAKKKKCTERVYGTVKEMSMHKEYIYNNGTTTSWYPIIEYNIGEQKFIKEYQHGDSKARYGIGQTIVICYNPEDYNEYYIEGEKTTNKIGTIFLIVGIVGLIIGIGVSLLFRIIEA